MKKIISLILSLAFLVIPVTSVFATNNVITVELDGKLIEFDVSPEIINDSTMVPLRKIFEEIGASVKWNDDTKTIYARKNSKTITLTVGTTELQIDKGKTDSEGNPIIETVTLETPAQIVSGRTLVPARAISESFGLSVDWDEDNSKVIIKSDDDDDNSWEENVGVINLTDLTFEGDGVEFFGNQIKVIKGGDYTLFGTLYDGNITISTKEKVKLRLSGVNIKSSTNPCIFAEDADKVYITLTNDTDNYLIAENSEDGAIYSKENLEIKGNGNLNIESKSGHGIKASDNLNIEKGNITINATSDGIHINDTFKMTDGTVNITSTGDGIDCESIIKISGGLINIETNATPVETTQNTVDDATETNRRPMWNETPDVEFEKSSKGINAEWMMTLSGGELNINSASHAIHCQDEIEINGGKFLLSSKYDKGISAHGNLTISGSQTYIDIKNSTEGIESKNVLTINDGIIKVVSTDDAINATGGNSATFEPGGNFAPEREMTDRGLPEDVEFNQTEQQPQTNKRPNRGENADFVRPRASLEVNENGLIAPSDVEMQDRLFVPPLENGMFIPPAETEPPTIEGGTLPGGFRGGMGRNMKACLIINGGYIEANGGDDSIDANGNIIINDATVNALNATGAFVGNFGVLDADGQLTINENANIILTSLSGSERGLQLSQNTIVINCENNHISGDKIMVSDNSGNVICEYIPNGNYKAVLIASGNIKTGNKYSVTIGEETFETEITQQTTVIGNKSNIVEGFGKRQRMQ